MGKRDVERMVKRLGGKVTRSSYAAAMGVDGDTARKALKGLVTSGVLKMEGTRRSAHYVVNKSTDVGV